MENVKIRECNRVFRGVSGKSIDVIGECLVKVRVSPSIQTFHIAVVVPDHLLDTDFLMGVDLIGKFDIEWSARKQTFTWAGHVYKTGQWPIPKILKLAGSIRRIAVAPTVLKEKESINLHLDRHLSLKKGTVEVVRIKTKAKDDTLEAKLKLGEKELSLLVRNQNGYVHLPIFNVSNNTLRLKKGHLLASVETVNDIEHLNINDEVIGNENE